MDERRQRIEQERRAVQEAAKKERTQTNKQVFQQVVGKDTRGGASNGSRGDEGAGTSTSEESDQRSPSPSDQQRPRRNSAERLAKQEQVPTLPYNRDCS